MAISLNLLERRALTAAVNKQALKEPRLFMEATLFPTVESHLSRVIDFEVIEGTDRMAAYVNPTEQSKLVEQSGTEVRSFSLPVTKEHNFHSAEELALRKGFGTDVYGATTGSIQQYRNQTVAFGTANLIARIRRRREWAAVQAATKGRVEYKGPSVHFVADFGFVKNKQLVKNTGADRWNQSGVDILSQGRTHSREISRRSGATPTICILGSDSAELFIKDETILKLLHNNNYRLGSIDATKQPVNGAKLIGTVGGVTYWEYAQSYTDNEGETQEMFPVNGALYAAPSRQLRRHRGIVAWEEEGLQNGQEFYTRSLAKKDPDGRKIEMASCEMPAIHDPSGLIMVTTH